MMNSINTFGNSKSNFNKKQKLLNSYTQKRWQNTANPNVPNQVICVPIAKNNQQLKITKILCNLDLISHQPEVKTNLTKFKLKNPNS